MRGPLKVALDGTPLLGARTGVGEFCFEALRSLSRRDDLRVSAFAVSWRRRHELSVQLPSSVVVNQRAMPARPLHLAWSHFSGPPVEWFIGDRDVVHGTNYVVPPTRAAARVVTVHDLTALRYPQMCDGASLAFPNLVRKAAAEGAWVHTPSLFVAEEVVSELGIDSDRVRWIHHGIPGRGEEDEVVGRTSPDDGFPGGVEQDLPPYVLAIGTVEPRKDYPLLVKAFDMVCEDVDDVVLVIAGADGWGTRALESTLESLPRRGRVRRLGYVDDSRRASLLKNAVLLVYPSLYEGFGFVPLEAMAAGVPVVATSAGAIPEVVDDAAAVVPPGEAESLAAAIRRLLTDEAARSDLVEKGLSRVKHFTWSACSAGLARLYADATSDRSAA